MAHRIRNFGSKGALILPVAGPPAMRAGVSEEHRLWLRAATVSAAARQTGASDQSRLIVRVPAICKAMRSPLGSMTCRWSIA